MRVKYGTNKETAIPKDELQKMGVKRASEHPDVHIPMQDLDKMIKMMQGK